MAPSNDKALERATVSTIFTLGGIVRVEEFFGRKTTNLNPGVPLSELEA
jgi:hypothetical protein